MAERHYYKLSGYLFYPEKRSNFWGNLESSGRMQNLQELLPGWFKFGFSPQESWTPEVEDLISQHGNSNAHSTFPFWVRKGEAGRLLLVSQSKDWVSELLRDLGIEGWLNNTPTVNVVGLMADLMAKPRNTDYALSTVWARVEGFGQHLNTIIMYGRDIPSAALFDQHISKYIVPYRLTLRDKGHEILSIGDKADVSFPFTGAISMRDIDRALRVIGKELGRLDWDVSNNDKNS